MLYVCVGNEMDVVFYVCIMRRGVIGARVLECIGGYYAFI